MTAQQRRPGRIAAICRWAAPALLAGLLSACSTPIKPAMTGYTCCNLRVYTDWVSSNNVQGGTIIPAGEPVELHWIKRQFYVYGTIGGADVSLRDDAAKSEADTMRWLQRIVTKEDPKLQFATWPADVRLAVRSARVMTGMTRAQVLMALGPPSRVDTPDMAAPIWRYWTAALDLPVDLVFGSDDRLIRLDGKPVAVQVIESKP